jgi:AmpE protein
MKLLVIVICLLSERFLIHYMSYQRFYWFGHYSKYMMGLVAKTKIGTNQWVLLSVVVLPLLCLCGLIYYLFHGLLFGLVGFILSLLIFYYCLGPQNPFYPLVQQETEEEGDKTVLDYFAGVNSLLFSVIFWYLILGPMGVLAYRLISLCRSIPELEHNTNAFTNLLEWIPARITMILFLLAGNFQRGFGYFMSHWWEVPKQNNEVLSQCALLAVRTNDSDVVPLPVGELFVECAVIIYLVIIALFTLASWM